MVMSFFMRGFQLEHEGPLQNTKTYVPLINFGLSASSSVWDISEVHPHNVHIKKKSWSIGITESKS